VGPGWAGENRECGGGGGRLAWVRCRFEFYLLLSWVSCPLSVFSLYSFFLPFLSYTYKLVLGFPCVSVQFRINALDLRETPSRLGLHNNALGLRETPSRLGLHNNALGLRETPSRLGLHNNDLSSRETPSQLGLHNNALNLPVSS
jgi:hypothetical protein